jgi:hypothetical protein
MATQLLAVGSTAASSSDLVVTDDVTVSIKGFTGPEAFVAIELKDDAAAYVAVGTLTTSHPATVISAPGTYRFTRRAGATCGVFSA